jgi:HAD superfamily hydrolase (TIGR01490 family)
MDATLPVRSERPFRPGAPVVWPLARHAIFDLDRTLIAGSSVAIWARELARRRLLEPTVLARALVREAIFERRGVSEAAAERLQVRLLRAARGRDAQPLIDAATDSADAVVARFEPALRRLIDWHRDRGDECIVLSAGPQQLVEVVAAKAGFHAGIGTRVEIVDGRLTGRLDGPFCHGAGKLARLRDEIGLVDLSGATAYSDSMSDLPLLQACIYSAAVNPDRHLRAEARRRGWGIISTR